MIINHITINDYKQFAGTHEIDLPSNATIGVIGANGVGKTTLFEAIEWCLYSPSAIKNQDIRPRGISSTPSVTILFEKPETGEQVLVERTQIGRAHV